MFAVGRGSEMGTQCHGDPEQQIAVYRFGRRSRPRDQGWPPQQRAGVRHPDTPGRERRGQVGTQEDLTGVRRRLERGDAGHARTEHHQLAMRVTRQAHQEAAGVGADRHSQRDPPGRCRPRSELPEGGLHRPRPRLRRGARARDR